QILYHKIGSDPKSDIVIVKADTKEVTNLWYAEFTTGYKYLMLYGFTDVDHSRVYAAPLDQPISANMKWISLQPQYGPPLQYVYNIDSDFYLVTKRDGAENHKIVRAKIDTSKARSVKDLSELTETIKTQDIIPENKNGNIENWSVIDKTKIVLIYLENAKYNFYLHDLTTGKRIQQLLTDFIGAFYRASYSYGSKQSFVELSAFTLGSGVYRIRSDNGKVSVDPFLIGNPKGIDMSEFKIEQHFATSKDGTKVPFDIFYSKKHPLDGTNPAWLLGYGSFGQKTIPYYDAFMLPWVRDHGGACVYMQIRGGGELGDRWHEAGMLSQRQHSFDDYQAVAEYLVKNKMAARGHIIGEGSEAGGTVAMVMGNQAPQGLFGVLLPNVALLDMLRFDKYPYPDQYIAEWGSPQKPTYFDVLRAYSPLHNVDVKKTYPAILLTQRLNDDSTTPAHSFKMIAELQHSLPKNANPLLM
ncbi:alpha/beta-hydrolase, partial [Meira miltonrushii]